MKKFCSRICLPLGLIGSLIAGIYQSVHAELRYTPNDPYPLYTADNPLAQYTFWQNCEREAPIRVSFSLFRQSANYARSNQFHEGSCTNAPASCPNPTTGAGCANCYFVCNKDVPIGNIYGPWNMIALLYPEANGNTTVQSIIINALNLTDGPEFGLENTAAAIECLTFLQNPFNSDPNQAFGFFDVPIKYRKYGFRLEADIGIGCTDFGLRIQTGVANIRQDATFEDLTCPALGQKCTVYDDACSETCCLVNNLGACDCKKLVINGIMRQANLAFKTLGYDTRNFCKTQMETINLALYWAHCYELNIGSKNSCWAHATLAPYAVGEINVPLSNDQNTNLLFSLPFGNNKHYGYGFTGGFTLNFIETIEIGFEAGFTEYSNEFYCAYPVPTSYLDQGIYPRRADLNKKPGVTWSFGATMGAYDFISCLSCFVQYRMVKHSQDRFCIIRPIPMTPPITTEPPNGTTCPPSNPNGPCATPDNFPASNICIDLLKQNSEWTSSFVDVHFTYDIAEHVALGFVWQTPVKQVQAYRSTTIEGSLIIKF